MPNPKLVYERLHLEDILASRSPEQINAAYDWLMGELHDLAITARERVVIARAAGQPTYNDFIATKWEAQLWWSLHHLGLLKRGQALPRLPGTPRPRSASTHARNLFQAVKDAVSVEELAERFTTLNPAGPGKLKGRCPLHEERTASFYIYQDSQRWQCFGACASGGDVVELARRLMDLGKLARRTKA